MEKIVQYNLARFVPSGAEWPSFSIYMRSHSSPRVNGKLVLQANPLTMSTLTTRAFQQSRSSDLIGWNYPLFQYGPGDPRVWSTLERLSSECREKLVRKVRKDPASLGVTFASWKQSAEMIRNSAKSASSIFEGADKVFKTMAHTSKRIAAIRYLYRRGREPSAGLVLQGFFGWQPLYGDIKNSLGVMGYPFPVRWASVKSRGSGYWTVHDNDWATKRSNSARFHCIVTAATGVAIENPNTWVLSQLGLLNPIPAAWDLVPWSFLVNAFSNVGSIVGSITDFAGLHLENSSITRRATVEETSTVRTAYGGNYSNVTATQASRSYDRVPGAIPEYSLTFRVPSVNWGNTAIASSLMLQNLAKLNRTVLGFARI